MRLCCVRVKNPEFRLTTRSDIMRLLRRHEAYPGMRYVTTATVNITFTVGTIHLLTAVQPATPPERRTEALSDARECIRYLKAMPWFCATKGGEALEKMLIDWNILPREPSPPIDLGQFGTTKDLGKLDSEISKFLLAAGWKPPQDAPAPPAPRVDQFSLNSASWTGSRGTDAGWDLMSTLAPGPGSYAFGNQAGQPGTVTQPAYGGSAGDYMSGAQGPAVIPFEVTQPTVTQPDLASFFPLDWAPYIPSLVDSKSGSMLKVPGVDDSLGLRLAKLNLIHHHAARVPVMCTVFQLYDRSGLLFVV